MKKICNYLRKAVAGVLFACALPFALVTAAFYYLVELIRPDDNGTAA